jgi:hypothetical protein
MIITRDRDRRLDALEAAFVSEMLGLESLALVAAKADHVADLEPHVRSWLADWGSYHERNGHAPLIKSALAVALDSLSVHRVAALIWHFHHSKQPAAAMLAANSRNSATEATLPASRVVVGPGSNYGRQEIILDGQSLLVPGSVAQILREIAQGQHQVRIRKEAWQQLVELAPWLSAMLERDPARKEVARKALYTVKPEARALISCTRTCTDGPE